MNFFNENYNTFILHAHMHSLLLQNKLSILPHQSRLAGGAAAPRPSPRSRNPARAGCMAHWLLPQVGQAAGRWAATQERLGRTARGRFGGSGPP